MFVLLDYEETVSRNDAWGMLGQISALPDQLEFSLSKSIDITPGNFSNICICGLGGSAMSGDIIRNYLDENSSYPTIVVRDTHLPKWVNEKSFALILSYSGNTTETLRMYHEAKSQGAKIVCVTSGGKLKELCLEDHEQYIEIPDGLQPRAALGYILGASAVVLKSAHLCNIADDLKRIIPNLKSECARYLPNISLEDNLAKKIASGLENTLPAVYGGIGIAPAVKRWRTQINENSKMLTICGILPELNHNQIVGWIESPSAPATPVFLRSVNDRPEIVKIIDATVSLFIDSGIEPILVNLEGDSQLECIMQGIILGDFVSYYLAALRNVDPTEIAPISRLKERMTDI